jgi:hypothetical protein
VRVVAQPVHLLAVRSHVEEDQVAVVVEPHGAEVGRTGAADDQDDSGDGTVEQLPVDGIQVAQALHLPPVTDLELAGPRPVGDVQDLVHPDRHRATPSQTCRLPRRRRPVTLGAAAATQHVRLPSQMPKRCGFKQ